MAVISGENRTTDALNPEPLDEGVDTSLQQGEEAGVGKFTVRKFHNYRRIMSAGLEEE
jgi:hypothetical protein